MVHEIGKLFGKHRRSVTLWSNTGLLFLFTIVFLGSCSEAFLLVIEGAGTGTVTGVNRIADSDFNCSITKRGISGICRAAVDEEIKLTATPGPGFSTIKWTGCNKISGANNRFCQIVESQEVEGRIEVFVTFGVGFTLSVTLEGAPGIVFSDIGGINCATPNTCSAAFAPGTDVMLTAELPGNFDDWSGSNCPIAGSTNPVETITMNADVACDANFNIP